MNTLHEINLEGSLLTENFVPRPRLDKIFDQATRCKLVYVIAGAGYGKTQAVHHYIKQQTDAAVRWVHLTDSDNLGSRYWENFTHSISFDYPNIAEKLRELGFPETLSRFKQFAKIVKTIDHSSRKTFFVLDDFHLIHSKEALTFTERCAHLRIPGVCVIIISRTEPEINAVSLFSKGQADRITEDDLRFTEDEIAAFLKQCGIVFSAKDLPQFVNATSGLALAIQLFSLVLKKNPKDIDNAFTTMKQNIFKLMETEAWINFPEYVQKMIVRLSLVSNLPLASLHGILHEDSLLQNAPELSSFVWFDSFTGDYRIHPLYLEFIQSKQDILSDEEKQDTYRRAAQWCSQNNFHMDAVRYYAMARQYKYIIEALLSYPFKLPIDTCEYFLTILEKVDPENKERNDQSILLLKNLFIPILLIGAGRYEEAKARSFDTIRLWEHADTAFSINLLYTAYSNLAYISMYTCTVTHQYDFSEYLKKSVEYYKLSSIPPVRVTGAFAVANIRSYACLVGEGADLPEFDQFLESVRKTASYIAETSHNMYYGYDDLAACEIAFFKNQTEVAKNHAHNAILKAREKKQYCIELLAQQYLLRMAVRSGDYSMVNEILEQLHSHLDNQVFWNRQLLYDLHIGFFYAQIGLAEMIPTWFIRNEEEMASEVRVPAKELIVSAKYYISSHKYSQALAILCKGTPREPQERFLFGELTLSLLMAVAMIKTGDTEAALENFNKAYELSFHGEFEMPFIELGKNLHPLVVAAGKRADGGINSCNGIPDEWLKTIDRKASAYAKKAAVIMNAIKREKSIEDAVQLSERERKVLNDLYHGLSREEIAAHQYVSVSTVNSALESIYTKFDVNSLVDAIRIALENKLIE